MKRLLFALLVVLLAAGQGWADATATSTLTAKGGNIDFGTPVNLTDPESGYNQQIDSAGAASVMEYPKTIANTLSGVMDVGVALVSSACRVHNIIVSGELSTALDYVLIYDAASATGTPDFDISIGTAGETVSITIPGGGTFSTGVYAIAGDAASSALTVTITYDN